MGAVRLEPVLALLAAAAMAPAAMASGGGGMGSGGMPSFSAPRYDPVQEYQQGMADYQAGKYRSAASHFENVTDSQPKSANSWYMLGMARSSDGDLKGAEKALGHSVKLDAAQVGPMRELAVTQAKLKENDKAGAQLTALKARAASCNDTCPDAADLKAAVAAVEQALGVVAPSASTKPLPDGIKLASIDSGDLAYTRAVSLINERRFAEALAALDKAEQAFGPHPDVLTYKGYVWRKLGRLDRAESYYKAALAEAPTHRGATEYYGELKVIRGDMAGARIMLARLETQCAFGCVEAEDLRRWIDHGGDPAS
ncbi:MAG TPA: tetratricopeptide repeat protein [Caulobacteraceae bacterium]|jgi:Flp pilus assembly protein TadD